MDAGAFTMGKCQICHGSGDIITVGCTSESDPQAFSTEDTCAAALMT